METKTNMNENFEHNTFDDFDDLQIQNEESNMPVENIAHNSNASLNIVIKDEMLEKNDAFIQTLSKYNNIIDLIKNYIIIKEENKIDGLVSLNLNTMDPLEAKNHIEKAYKELKLDVELVNFLNAGDFEKICKNDLLKKESFKELEDKEKNSYIELAIERLSKNDTLQNKDFIRKLFKLKKIDILVEDSISLTNLKDNYLILMQKVINELNVYIKDLIHFYENKNQLSNTSSQEDDYDLLEDVKKDDEFEKKLEDLQNQLKEITLENENNKNQLEESIEKISELKEKNRELENANFILKEEMKDLNSNVNVNQEAPKSNVDLSLFSSIEGIDTSKDDNEIILDVLEAFETKEKTIETLKQEMMDLPSKEIHDSLVEDISKLENKVQKLEDELIEKEKEIIELNSTTKNVENAEINIISKEKKKLPTWAKVLLIIAAVIVSLFILLRVAGNFINLEDEPIANTNYVMPPVVNNTTNNTPAPSVTPQNNVPVVEAYDYEKALTVDEFQQQKFDIFTDNWEKIRVNGKDFLTNQTINGFKFIRANSSGKILFMNNNQDPIWIEMR